MISLGLILFSSLFVLGIIARVKSLTSGRKGPGILQPLYDMYRLLRKGIVYSETSSWIFQVAPALNLATVFIAAMLIPFGESSGLISFTGDYIYFAYILALGKVFIMLAALDTGSPFEGMGTAREGLFSLLVEPAFFLLIGSFGLLTGHTSFHAILEHIHFDNQVSVLMGGLAAYILFQIAMVETSRLPVDDPKTHLELTMVHEVMVLDHSGPDLAFIQYSVALKMAIFAGLIANFIIPPSLPIVLQGLLFLGIQTGFGVLVGLAESFRPRKRMRLNIDFIFSLTSLAILLFFSALVLTEKFINN